MADKSISQLSPGVAVTDTDLLPNVQVVGVGPVKTTAVQIKTYVNTNPNVTGVIKAQLGSAAAPSYTFDGDLNTGWFSPAADTVASATAGVERMRVDSAGSVGIGITPSAWGTSVFRALQVFGGSIYADVRAVQSGNVNFGGNVYFDGTNSRYIANNAAGSYAIGANDGGSHTWSISSAGTAGGIISFTQAMKLNASGNLGIGTTSPATRAHIVGTDTELRVQSDTTANGFIRFINTSGSMSVGMSGGPTNTLLTYDRTNSQTAHEYLGGASGYHAWSTVGQERMRIDNIGNVGIGQVSVTPVFGRTISAFNASGATYRVTGSSVSAYLYAAQGLGTTGVTSETNHPLVFGTNSTERMRIDTSGNVGIGATPSLWVTTARALQIGATGALWQSASGFTFLTDNVYVDSGSINRYITTNFATIYRQQSGQHNWFTAASGTAGNAITFTQAMTLTEQGSLLVGATATTGYKFITYTADGTFPASGDTSASYALISGASRTGTSIVSSSYATTLVLQSNTDSNAAGTGASLGFQGKWDSGNYASAAQFASIFGGKENSTLANLSGYLSFATRPNGGVPTERARITSAGNLLVGTTADSSGGKLVVSDLYPYITILGTDPTTRRAAILLTNAGGYWTIEHSNDLTIKNALPGDPITTGAYATFGRSSGALILGTNGTERMRIDSSGNVGIALAPSAWLSSYRALNVQTGSMASAASSSELYVSANAFLDTGPTWKYVANSQASQYRQAASVHSWHIAASGTAGNAITFTQAMTLDASGNLGIGTTGIGGGANDRQLTLSGPNSAQTTFVAATSSVFSTVGVNSTVGYVGTTSNHSFVVLSNNTERMRIDGAGNVGIGMAAVAGQGILQAKVASGYAFKFGQTSTYAYIAANNEAGTVNVDLNIIGKDITFAGNGSTIVGAGAIGTTATTGFLYVPGCAGTPTGTPTTFAGRVPIVVDTTNNKLYFYSGGAWRDAGP